MEIWRDIYDYRKGICYKGYYQVSNLGNIRSLDRFVNNGVSKRFIKGQKIRAVYDHKGYVTVTLKKEGKQNTRFIHRLVLYTFVGNSTLDINHKNGVTDDNRVENLEYCTKSENMLHAYKELGLKQDNRGIKNPRCRKVNQYTLDGEFIKTWDYIKEAVESLGYKSSANIIRVCNGSRENALGFIWKYYD